jgi:hypothetical protein
MGLRVSVEIFSFECRMHWLRFMLRLGCLTRLLMFFFKIVRSVDSFHGYGHVTVSRTC